MHVGRLGSLAGKPRAEVGSEIGSFEFLSFLLSILGSRLDFFKAI